MEKMFISISKYFLFVDQKRIADFFYRKFISTNVKHAITGNIAFNDEGDRIESLYEIINIQHGQSKVVGSYRSNAVSL